MRRLLLASAAVASLVIGLPAVQAQQADDNLRNRSPGASQQASPQAGDREGDRAAPRQGRGNEAAQPQRAPAGEKPARAADDSRQRGTSGARAQDEDRPARGRAERSKSTGQAGERSGEQRRDARDRSQRDEARDERRDRADQERSRTSRDRAGDRDRERADRDRGRDPDRADRDRARERTTTGQSRDERAAEPRRSRDADRPDRDRRDRADRQDSRRDQDSRRGSVSLSQDQRVRISARFSDRIDRLNVRPLSRSRLSASVGVVVPSSIRLYDVPVDIVEIYPGFRGHKFVVVEDEIVIIEPRSRRVVTTISRSGDRSASRSTTGAASAGARVRFREEERDIIRTIVMREADCRYETRLDFTIGLPLPRTVEICEFPDAVFAEVPEARRYRYVVRGDDIVIVDPDEHRIVEVID